MELTLFDFDFSEEQEKMFSEERIKEKFNELIQYSKKEGNPHYLSIRELPNNMYMYLEKFIEKGWVKQNETGVYIPDKYLDYHTLDELIDMFEESINKVTRKENVCWYSDILQVINHVFLPTRIQKEVEQNFRVAKKEITKKYALKFGLQHFKNVKSSRGHKKDFGKWVKKNVFPIIIENILNLSTYEEVEEYFNKNIFFCGRRDENMNSVYAKIAPYPEFYKFSPSYLEIASLAQATTEKDVKLILDYCGILHYGLNAFTDYGNAIYPDGWSFERYLAELTDEDKVMIYEDRERLKRLHGRDIFEDAIFFELLKKEEYAK